MPPSRDDFARWRDDHVTQWVIRAHEAAAEANKAKWVDLSWGSGSANQAMLTEWRTLADAYMAISQATYESFCDMLGERPVEG